MQRSQLFAIWSAKPARDISWRTTGRPFAHARDMSHLYDAFLRYTVMPFFPVQSPRSHFFWNPMPHRSGLAYAVVVVIGFRDVVSQLSPSQRHSADDRRDDRLRNRALAFHLSGFGAPLRCCLPRVSRRRVDYSCGESVGHRSHGPFMRCLAISALSSVWAVIGSWKRPFSYDMDCGEMDRTKPSGEHAARGRRGHERGGRGAVSAPAYLHDRMLLRGHLSSLLDPSR